LFNGSGLLSPLSPLKIATSVPYSGYFHESFYPAHSNGPVFPQVSRRASDEILKMELVISGKQDAREDLRGTGSSREPTPGRDAPKHTSRRI
jgi:hypothetical protein